MGGRIGCASAGGVLNIFDTKQPNVTPIPPLVLPNPPAQSRTNLLAMLTVSGEEDFESFVLESVMGPAGNSAINANGIIANITAAGGIGEVSNITDNGRYNTTPFPSGVQYWSFTANPLVSALLTFSTPIASFWLYATDLGDFNASLEITFNKTGGGSDVYLPDAPPGAASGQLNFFGIVDDRGTVTYDSVALRRTNIDDVFGFDGIGFCTAAKICR